MLFIYIYSLMELKRLPFDKQINVVPLNSNALLVNGVPRIRRQSTVKSGPGIPFGAHSPKDNRLTLHGCVWMDPTIIIIQRIHDIWVGELFHGLLSNNTLTLCTSSNRELLSALWFAYLFYVSWENCIWKIVFGKLYLENCIWNTSYIAAAINNSYWFS